jgi:hypothetical protein
MADLPTRLDLFGIGRDYVVQRAEKIDPEQVDIVGSDVNLFVGSAAYIGAQVVDGIRDEASKLLLSTADGEDLDRLAWDRYKLIRKGASSALGEVRFYRDDATGGAGVVPIDTVLATKTGIEYVTTTTATFSATATEATAYVRSVQAGSTQQAGANAIRLIKEPSQLFDSSLKVNNDAATAHGSDGENDDVFRGRVRDFWNVARRGTLGAIEFGARQVAGIESANAVEEIEADATPARVVNLYVADESGIASLAIADQVREALNEWRAAGISVVVYTTAVQNVTVTYSLTFKAGVATAPVVENIRAATVEAINQLGANDTLYRSKLFAILEMYKDAGLLPDESSIVEPAGDIVPANNRTLRTTLDSVTVQ